MSAKRELLVERGVRFERLIRDKPQERNERGDKKRKPQVKWVTSNARMQVAGEDGRRCVLPRLSRTVIALFTVNPAHLHYNEI